MIIGDLKTLVVGVLEIIVVIFIVSVFLVVTAILAVIGRRRAVSLPQFHIIHALQTVAMFITQPEITQRYQDDPTMVLARFVTTYRRCRRWRANGLRSRHRLSIESDLCYV